MSEKEWRRFTSYSQRVRSWTPDREGSDSGFFCQLERKRPGINFFPYLRQLALYQRIDPPPVLILPQSLRRLEINFNYWTTTGVHPCEQYLSAAIEQAPALEVLYFYGPMPLFILTRLSELCCLQSLELGDVDLPKGAMSILSSLPALKQLELPRTPLEDDDITPTTGFNHLQSLTLSGRPSSIMALIDTVASSALRTISIRNSPLDTMPGSFTQWKECFEKIKERFGPTLRSVNVAAVARDDGVQPAELLQPLMDLRELEEFQLSDLTYPSIQDISRMASSWPKLKRFVLDVPPVQSHSHGNTDASRPSAIHCLTFFARHCPQLISLDLGIADEDLPDVEQFPSLSHNLQSLRLQAPVVRDYKHLARLLDTIFPELARVMINDTFVDPPQDGENRYWLDVPDLIRTFQTARQGRR